MTTITIISSLSSRSKRCLLVEPVNQIGLSFHRASLYRNLHYLGVQVSTGVLTWKMVPWGVLNLISIVLQVFHKHRCRSRIASQTLWITLHTLVAVYLGQEFVHKLSFVSKLYTFAVLYLVRPPVSLWLGCWEILKLFILMFLILQHPIIKHLFSSWHKSYVLHATRAQTIVLSPDNWADSRFLR